MAGGLAPRLDGILESALYVDDLERSAHFYQTVFGFERVASADRLYAMGVGERQLLLLCRKKASANLPLGAHDGDGRLHLAFAIPADQLEPWEAWLRSCDVPIEEKKLWERGGCSLYFRDPDGHILELAMPGVWPAVY